MMRVHFSTTLYGSSTVDHVVFSSVRERSRTLEVQTPTLFTGAGVVVVSEIRVRLIVSDLGEGKKVCNVSSTRVLLDSIRSDSHLTDQTLIVGTEVTPSLEIRV